MHIFWYLHRHHQSSLSLSHCKFDLKELWVVWIGRIVRNWSSKSSEINFNSAKWKSNPKICDLLYDSLVFNRSDTFSFCNIKKNFSTIRYYYLETQIESIEEKTRTKIFLHFSWYCGNLTIVACPWVMKMAKNIFNFNIISTSSNDRSFNGVNIFEYKKNARFHWKLLNFSRIFAPPQ